MSVCVLVHLCSCARMCVHALCVRVCLCMLPAEASILAMGFTW